MGGARHPKRAKDGLTMKTQTTRNAVPQPKGELLVVITCPHCGKAWSWTLDRWAKKVITCPSDEGGCDKDFVAALVHLEATINVYELS